MKNTQPAFPAFTETRNVVIHHTGFWFPTEEEPGMRELAVSAPSGATDTAVCEAAFEVTNNPNSPAGQPRYGKSEGAVYTLSCGDFVEVDGNLYLCVSAGWRKVSVRNFNRLVNRKSVAHGAGRRFDMNFDGVRLLNEWEATSK